MSLAANITIKDIAKRLGISSSTVSRALHDHPDISSETKQKVMSVAEELDYHPNTIAQSLKSMRTNTIGVIVPEIKHDFFSFVLDGIEDVTYRAGYTISVSKSNESVDREVINTRAMVSNRVAGLIVSISQNTKDSSHFKILQQRNIPIVFFDRVCEDIEASKVVVDDYDGAFKMVEFLIQSGYRKIAHVAAPQFLTLGSERLRGYKEALQKNGMPYNENYVVIGGFNEEDGVAGFNTIRERNLEIDAIFAVNDPVAIGIFMRMKELGLNIPHDVALAGFSDNPIASLIDPPLTTVAQPAYELGASAARLLLQEINKDEDEFHPKTEILKTRLIIRRST